MQMDAMFAVSAAAEKAVRLSRYLAVLALVGIVAILAGLAALYFDARAGQREAEQSERNTRVALTKVSEQLDEVRQAYAAGDMRRVGIRLGLAIDKTEELIQRPTAAVAAAPAEVNAAEALAYVRQTPEYDVPKQAGHNQKVYIQFAGSLDRAQITALNSALRDAGWDAQGRSGERLASSAGLNEVRYSGANREAAAALAEAINAAGIAGARVEPKEVGIIKGDTLEAWISN
jgi:hypothetical protein